MFFFVLESLVFIVCVQFPQRSAKSWTEYYRRYERRTSLIYDFEWDGYKYPAPEVDKLARKIRARRNDEQKEISSIRSQRARPTWASSSNINQPKRKHDPEDEVTNPSKRGRESGDA